MAISDIQAAPSQKAIKRRSLVPQLGLGSQTVPTLLSLQSLFFFLGLLFRRQALLLLDKWVSIVHSTLSSTLFGASSDLVESYTSESTSWCPYLGLVARKFVFILHCFKLVLGLHALDTACSSCFLQLLHFVFSGLLGCQLLLISCDGFLQLGEQVCNVAFLLLKELLDSFLVLMKQILNQGEAVVLVQIEDLEV